MQTQVSLEELYHKFLLLILGRLMAPAALPQDQEFLLGTRQNTRTPLSAPHRIESASSLVYP
jgi:hypothetical protein